MSSEITGQDLACTILKAIGLDEHTAEVEIYDSQRQVFVSSLASHVKDEDVVSRFGTRVRCSISCKDENKRRECSALLGRHYPYDARMGMQFAGIRLHVEETPNLPGAGTGLNVWDGAMLLTQYLERRPNTVRSQRVLELGAGCGLVGIAAGVLGASEVILTDLPYVLPLMRANVDRHRQDIKDAGCRRIDCMTCDWFDPPTLTDFGASSASWQVDVILVADCVWVQELVSPLLATIRKFVEESISTISVFISYQQRGKSAHDEFWGGLNSIFHHIMEVDTPACGLAKPNSLHIYECKTRSES